jgi:Methyltransferase domain
MKRTVETEWLDELPPDDPAALGSRRDIKRLNWVMGNAGILSRMLHPESQQPRRIVEIGAGDGLFMLRLAQHLSPSWKNMEVVLVDDKPSVVAEARNGLHALGWTVEVVTADVFDWLKRPKNGFADVMIANLFLHQFSDAQLTKMLALARAQTKLFAACEPRRALGTLAMSYMVGFIGCNVVSRHDAPVSVRAGFTGKEISALWPAQSDWRLEEHSAQFFNQTFLAKRADGVQP